MDLDVLKKFLLSFEIEKIEIENYLQDKKLFLKFNHTYLVEKGFSGKKVFDNQLLYIELAKVLPSKYFLLTLKDLTKKSLFLRSRDVSLKFLYGKNLSSNLDYGVELKENQRYLVDYQGEILGYVLCMKIGSELILQNDFHIGEYLREN
jgi:hypothetical protein